MWKWLNLVLLLSLPLFLVLMLPMPAGATTYYVDYAHGIDSHTAVQAQSKTTPWKYAPGMDAASSYAASTTVNAGDSVILKGCVSWQIGRASCRGRDEI